MLGGSKWLEGPACSGGRLTRSGQICFYNGHTPGLYVT